MPGRPWWLESVAELPNFHAVAEATLGGLWRAREQIAFIRENVDPANLPLDFARASEASQLWAGLAALEALVDGTLEDRVADLAGTMRSGALSPEHFRRHWSGLGFEAHARTAGTPADDFLDGAFNVARLTLGEPRPACGLPNMASRAGRVADFLSATSPGPTDVVFDLGSGSGKVSLTVAASTAAQVRGVELGGSYVRSAQATAAFFGLATAQFIEADVREVDLSAGTIFYLFYPFHGAVAREVAILLGALARQKEITLYVAGPRNDFGEHFLAEAARGSLTLAGTRGEFGEALLFRS